MRWSAKFTSFVSDSATLWARVCQAPLSMGFSRQEHMYITWGHMYTYYWIMLMFDRKQQNSVRQLSLNLKVIFLKTKKKKKNTGVSYHALLQVIFLTQIKSQISSVQFSRSVVSDSATPWIAARQASLSITNSRSLFRHVHRVSNAIQPSHPLSSPSPPDPNPSQH